MGYKSLLLAVHVITALILCRHIGVGGEEAIPEIVIIMEKHQQGGEGGFNVVGIRKRLGIRGGMMERTRTRRERGNLYDNIYC